MGDITRHVDDCAGGGEMYPAGPDFDFNGRVALIRINPKPHSISFVEHFLGGIQDGTARNALARILGYGFQLTEKDGKAVVRRIETRSLDVNAGGEMIFEERTDVEIDGIDKLFDDETIDKEGQITRDRIVYALEHDILVEQADPIPDSPRRAPAKPRPPSKKKRLELLRASWERVHSR